MTKVIITNFRRKKFQTAIRCMEGEALWTRKLLHSRCLEFGQKTMNLILFFSLTNYIHRNRIYITTWCASSLVRIAINHWSCTRYVMPADGQRSRMHSGWECMYIAHVHSQHIQICISIPCSRTMPLSEVFRFTPSVVILFKCSRDVSCGTNTIHRCASR